MRGGTTFLRAMENSFSHCLHWVASSSFSQAWPWRSNGQQVRLSSQHH